MNDQKDGGTPRPRNASEHLLAAADFAASGRFDEAENAFAAAMLQDPELHIARFQLGLLQWTLGRPGIALVIWLPLTASPVPDGLDRFVQAFFALAATDMVRAAQEFRAGLAHCANVPLAADMQRLLDNLEPSAPGADDGDSEHVLLANYRSNALH